MSTKEKRLDTFNKMWNVLGLNLFGKYNDFEKKYGNATSTQTTAVTKLDLQKLMKIDSTIKKTTSPDQVIYTSDDKSQIFIFFSDGNFRLRSNSVNDKNGEITGRWKFLGNDSYQINTSDGDVYTYSEGWKGVPATSETAGGKLDLQKLMKIDGNIKKTTSPDQVVRRIDDNIWIFWSDGNFRLRYSSINNKDGEWRGRWRLIGDNDYELTKSDGYKFLYSRGEWVRGESTSSSGSSGKTWRDVTFTLADVAAGKAVLKRGDKGPAVEELQKLMIQMNLSKVSKSGKPDGKFGKLTELSIKQFQGEMAHGEQDGKVGKKTLNRMYYVYNYDPDKEVDDEQPQAPATSDKYSPQGVPDDAYNTQTPPDETQNTTPETQQPEQPRKKLVLTPKVVQENEKKIVSPKVKSLQLSDIYRGV